MINVKSKNGFYYTNPQDYLDGKINNLHSTYYEAYTISTHKFISCSETLGWSMGVAQFIGKNGVTITKEKMASLLEEEFKDYNSPFYVQKLRLKLDRGDMFPIEDYNLYKGIKEDHYNDMGQVVSLFKQKAHFIIDKKDLPEYFVINIAFTEKDNAKSDFGLRLHRLLKNTFGEGYRFSKKVEYSTTSKVINGDNLTSINDINGNPCKVGDQVYYSPCAGGIKLGTITKFTDISILIDGECYGQAKKVDILKAN